MKKLLLCVLAFGAFCAGLGFAQSDDVDRALQQLRKGLADLGMRVSRLEHAGGTTAAAPAPARESVSAATGPARTMILVSVSQSDHTSDHSDEIASLKRHHASLMNTVDQSKDQADEDFGQEAYAVGRRGRYGGGITTNVGSRGRKVLADEHMANRYATHAAMKKEKLERLQAADARPKQILHGHDQDGTVFTLETKHDLTSTINNISIGDTVTWTGTRQSADSGEETWLIDTIKKVR